VATVIYAPEAEDDLIGIVDYLARDKPRAARDWLAKIRQTCELLATHQRWANCARALAFRVAAHSVWGIT